MHRKRWVLAISVAVVVSLALGWFVFVRSYFFDATFMAQQSGSSTTTVGCHPGDTEYFGYPLEATHGLQITGVSLVGVPSSYTVEGIYAVNIDGGKYAPFGGGTQSQWDDSGYGTARLYPVTAVNTAAGPSGWWLVAKVVPHELGLQTIQGIKIDYKSGWRSGSVIYNESAASNCV
jgi:hypothetical protein